MKKTLLTALFGILTTVNLIGCAQRFERPTQAKGDLPRESRFSTQMTTQFTSTQGDPSVILDPDKSVSPEPTSANPKSAEPAPKMPSDESINSQIPTAANTGSETSVTGPRPPVLSIPGASSNETPVACGIELTALEESAGAEFMRRFQGFWIEDESASIRSVENSPLSAAVRPAFSLGMKNDEIAISKVSFKQAQKFASGTSPYVVSSVEKKAQAFSYIVGAEVKGFRLVQISFIGDKSSKMSCMTFGLRLSAETETLLVAGPLKSIESLATNNEAKIHSYKKHAVKNAL